MRAKGSEGLQAVMEGVVDVEAVEEKSLNGALNFWWPSGTILLASIRPLAWEHRRGPCCCTALRKWANQRDQNYGQEPMIGWRTESLPSGPFTCSASSVEASALSLAINPRGESFEADFKAAELECADTHWQDWALCRRCSISPHPSAISSTSARNTVVVPIVRRQQIAHVWNNIIQFHLHHRYKGQMPCPCMRAL